MGKKTVRTHSNDPVNGKCGTVEGHSRFFLSVSIVSSDAHSPVGSPCRFSRGGFGSHSPVYPVAVGLQNQSKRSSETRSPSDGGWNVRSGKQDGAVSPEGTHTYAWHLTLICSITCGRERVIPPSGEGYTYKARLIDNLLRT